MPAYTPTAEHTNTNLSDTPESFEGHPSVYSTTFKALMDRQAFARAGLAGQLVWSGQMWAAGTAAVPQVWVGPITAVVLQRNGGTTWETLSGAATTLGIAAVEGAPANLANSTWYYVYAYNNAGALAYQISTTPPTLAPSPGVLEQWKRGASGTHRYLACFVTDGAGNPLPVRGLVGGGYTYAFDSIAFASPLRVLNAGSAIAWAAVSCTAVIPPHAFLGRFYGVLGDAAALNYLQVRATGTATSQRTLAVLQAISATFVGSADFTQNTDAAQSFDYQLNAATGTCSIYCTGFWE